MSQWLKFGIHLGAAIAAILLIAETAQAANHTVEARPDNTFAPAALTIEAGDTVTFVNAGGFHNVAADDGSFRCANGCDGTGGDGSPAGNAWSVTLTFNQVGTIPYNCEVHVGLGMVGTITVQQATQEMPGTLRFSTNSQSRGEGAGTFSIQVDRTGGDDGAVSVNYATSDGSAQGGVDYTPATGQLTWADNDDSSKFFQVTILDDGEDETNETVNLALSGATGGAAIGTPSVMTLTIQDDDETTPQPGQLSFVSQLFETTEGAGQASINVARTGGTEGAVGVDYSTSDGSAQDGSDYSAATGTLNWADGEGGTKSFDIAILDDEEPENSEAVNLSLSNPSGGASLGTSSATLNIADDDTQGVGCIDDEKTLCLRSDKRFQITVRWRDFEDGTGDGKVLDFAPVDSGLFYFFDPDNAELLLKVLNGCGFNGHYWFFSAAVTNVEYEITVTDLQAGVTRIYSNPLGQTAETVTDTEAFATCP